MFLSKAFYIAFGTIVSVAASFVPKRSDLWVFGCCRGTKYAENAKYLFEYVQEQHQSIQCVWVSKDRDIVETLRQRGYKAYGILTFAGLWYSARAGVAIITHRGNSWDGDVPFFCLSNHTVLVQLWHGIPLKKIAFDDRLFSYAFNENSLSFKLRSSLAKLLPFVLRVEHPSLVISTSEETKGIFSKAFRTPPDRVVVTGYPRNDELYKRAHAETPIQRILYMPTFRGLEGSSFDPFEDQIFGIDALEAFFVEKNMQLHIKLHPFNRMPPSLLQKIESTNYLSALCVDDIYETLCTYDVLITDYSSIYFDFLLTGKPIIFLPYDLDRYTVSDRQFYYKYEDVTPGPKARDWHDVSKILADLDSMSSRWQQQYLQTLDRFHQYKDGKSCERVVAAIQNLVR